jgi:peptide/nickel transport system permease protein
MIISGYAEPPPMLENPEGAETARSTSQLSAIVFVFSQNRMAVASAGFLIFLVLFCFVGPLIYHTDQIYVNLSAVSLPPSLHHPLGTDNNGYDELGRLMLGGQTTIEVCVTAAVLAMGLGVVYGVLAAFLGGWVDNVMMRVVDVLLAIPSLLLLLFLATIFVPNLPLLILIVASIAWLVPSRLIRGEVLSLRTREYVQAARLVGGSGVRIIVHHLIPNALGTVIVNATFQVADAVLLVAYLSFLGLGIPPPATNWGAMLSSGVNFVFAGDWWLIWPVGVAIILTVVAFNFIGDALRDALDVRLRSR